MSAPGQTAGRLQQAIPSGLVLLLALWIAYVSFNVADPGPYLFPRLIAVAMLALAGFSFQRALRGKSQTGSGLELQVLGNIAPGVAVMLLYVFLAADYLGFYLASFIAFLALYVLYDPERRSDAGLWVRRLGITVGFMAVIYVLFALVLKVQTPRGILM